MSSSSRNSQKFLSMSPFVVFLLVFVIETAFSKECTSKSLGVSKDLHSVTKILNISAQVEVDWVNLVKPPECYIHLSQVVLHYDNPNDTAKCCQGFKNITRQPKEKKNPKPFVVKLCRKKNSTGNRLLYLEFQVGNHAQKFKETLHILPLCKTNATTPSNTTDPSSKPVRRGHYWAVVAVAGIFAALLLFFVILLVWHHYQARKSNTKEAEGSNSGVQISKADELNKSKKNLSNHEIKSQKTKDSSPQQVNNADEQIEQGFKKMKDSTP